MKKVLFLTPELPYPPVSGGKLKSWKLLEFLTKNYQVSVGSILKNNDEDNICDFLSKTNISEFIYSPVQRSRSLPNLIKSYFYKMPLNLYRTHSNSFARNIKSKIYDYDMVISDHYEVFQYIPEDYKGSVVLHEHNAYYLMWDRYAKAPEHSFGKRIVSYFEARRVKVYEKKACDRADVVFASPNDIVSLEALGVNLEKFRYTYHLGDDSQLHLPNLKFENTTKSLLYIGSLGWEANIDGLLWFFEQVWPELNSRHPDLIFTIVGKNPDQRLLDASMKYKNIKFTGFVEDLEPYFQQHRVFVAPLRFGAGMKVKVLNAMCRGIPTVTTSVGIEGIDIQNLKEIAVTDDSTTMFRYIDLLLTDQKAWEVIEHYSRQLIAGKYTWQALFSDMKNELEKTLQQQKQSNDSDSTNKMVLSNKSLQLSKI